MPKEIKEKELTKEKEMTMSNEVNKVSQTNDIKQYKKEDCELGFLTDQQEIQEYKRQQQIDMLQNELLGDYANDGEYYLSDEIRDELVKVPKVVTHNYENYIFAQTLIPIGEYGHGKFFVMVNKLGKGLIATLTFVEPIHKMNKLLTNAQSVQIASFAGDGGEKFFYEMKKEFNIVDDDYIMPDEEVKKAFIHCLKRKNYRRKLWREALKDIERTEKEIYNKRMDVLKKLKNEYSKEVLDLFNEQLKKKGPFINKAPNQFTCLNQLLDECLGMISGKYPILEVKAFEMMNEAIKPAVAEQEHAIDNIKTQISVSNTKSGGSKTITRQPRIFVDINEREPITDFDNNFKTNRGKKKEETQATLGDFGAQMTITNAAASKKGPTFTATGIGSMSTKDDFVL